MQAMALAEAHATPGETQILGLLGGLLVLAFFANRLSRRTRVPDILILMLTGVVLGPVSGWLHAGEFPVFTQYLGTFALILILFEAGTEIHLRETLRHFPAGLLFALMSFGLSLAIVACIGHWILGFTTHKSLLFGGVLGCVSGTIVIPVLQQFGIGGPVAVVLVLEAALGDVIAVITVGSLTNIAEGDPLLGGLVRGLVIRTAIAVVAAVLAALFWSHLRSRFAADRFGGVLQVGMVLVVFAVTRIVGGSGLLSVLAFGLTLANRRGAEDGGIERSSILLFHSDLSFLIRSFFFVLLGASVELIGPAYLLATTAVLGGLALARIASVYTLNLATRVVKRSERNLLISLLPRGLVNAVLAIQVARRAGDMNFLPAMTFTVILVTTLVMVLLTFRLAPFADQSGAVD